MEGGDRALRIRLAHRLQFGPNISADDEQPSNVAKAKLQIENQCRRHGRPLSAPRLRTPLADRGPSSARLSAIIWMRYEEYLHNEGGRAQRCRGLSLRCPPPQFS